MSLLRGACPGCELLIEIEPDACVRCPICTAACSPATLKPADPAAHAEREHAAATLPTPAAQRSQVLRGAGGLGILLFLAGGLLWAYQQAPRAASVSPHRTSSAPALPREPPAAVLDVAPVEAAAEPAAPPAAPSVDSQPSEASSAPSPPARPPEGDSQEDRIERSIQQGIAYLRRCQTNDHCAGLHGLTLLECGAQRNDPQVAELAAALRRQRGEMHQTYELALAILFLSQLGEPADRGLVRTYALRLAAGQNGDGAWTYTCPLLSAGEERRIEAELRALRHVSPDTGIDSGLLASPLPPPPPPEPQGSRRSTGKSRTLAWQEPSILGPFGPAAAGPRGSRRQGRGVGSQPRFVSHPAGDHSNTQFALLGLWTARRQGLPLEWPLRRAAYHFRTTRAAEGFWGYFSTVVSAPGHPFTATSTCAGLLSLAMDYGLSFRREGTTLIRPAAPVSDPAILSGMGYLGEVLQGKHRRAHLGFGAGNTALFNVDARGDLYFLWTLERVAVIYEVKQLGGTDWYHWAAPRVVACQQLDGSWRDLFPPLVDTCFALLALTRSNVVEDLTESLHDVVAVGPPQSFLRYGPTSVRKRRPPLELGPTRAPASQARPGLHDTFTETSGPPR